MRVAIVVAAALGLFACERGVDSAQPYGVGKGYGGPGHAYANSTGGSVFLVVPADATDFSAVSDVPAEDGVEVTEVYDFGPDASDEMLTCGAEHVGFPDFCLCEYGAIANTLHDYYCECKYLTCVDPPHPEGEDLGLICGGILDAIGEDLGTCTL